MQIVGAVRGNAESVATASAQISQGNADLSARIERQAANLEETAASMEQMAAAIAANAQHANQADALARAARIYSVALPLLLAAFCAAALLSGDKVTLKIEAMDKGQAERLLPLLEELLAETGTAMVAPTVVDAAGERIEQSHLKTALRRARAAQWNGPAWIRARTLAEEIAAGTTNNIIPETAHLLGTIRTLSPQSRARVAEELHRLAPGIAAAHGCSAEVHIEQGFPVTVCDDRAVQFGKAVVEDMFGAESWLTLDTPIMGAEDFAFFVDQKHGIPGYYFGVGGTKPEWIAAAKNGGPAVAGHHSPLFKIDPEPSVRLGIEATTAAVLDLLGPSKN